MSKSRLIHRFTDVVPPYKKHRRRRPTDCGIDVFAITGTIRPDGSQSVRHLGTYLDAKFAMGLARLFHRSRNLEIMVVTQERRPRILMTLYRKGCAS